MFSQDLRSAAVRSITFRSHNVRSTTVRNLMCLARRGRNVRANTGYSPLVHRATVRHPIAAALQSITLILVEKLPVDLI